MKHNRLMAILSVLVALCVVSTALYVTDDEPEQLESQDSPLGAIALTIALAAVGIAYAGGLATGWFKGYGTAEAHYTKIINEMKEQQGKYETEVVRLVIDGEKQVLLTAYDSQADLWGFTNSHWQRQAEIAAASLWESGKSINYTQMLQASTLYSNLSTFSDNLMKSPDYIFSFMQNRLDNWNRLGDNTMSLMFNIGSPSKNMSDDNKMDISLRSVVDVQSEEHNEAYLYPGEFWVFGGSATITNDRGNSIVLQEGKTDLSSVDGFKEGNYILQAGRQYAGSVLPSAETNFVSLKAGAILHYGTNNKLALYDDVNNKIIVDNAQYSQLKIDVSSGSGTESIDVVPILEKHKTMMNAVSRTVGLASTAGGAAWSIFTNANAASALISPSSMVSAGALESVSEDQLALIGTVSLRQLSQYYSTNGEYLEKAQYKFSPDSLGVYVRGNIYTAEKPDKPLYENVIFSPFVWNKELQLKAGSKTAVSQAGLLAVFDQWGAGSSKSLKDWNSTVLAKNCNILDMESGYTIETYEIMIDGELRDSYTLSVEQISEWEGGGEQGGDGPPFLPDKEKGKYDKYAILVFLVIALIGAYIAYNAYRDGDTIITLVGLAIVVVGYLLRMQILHAIVGLL